MLQFLYGSRLEGGVRVNTSFPRWAVGVRRCKRGFVALIADCLRKFG